jgi:hypothetical protein
MSSSSSNPLWVCYLWARVLVGTPDFLLDALHASSLYNTRHPWWATLTLAFPIIAVAAAAISVLIGRSVLDF